MDIDNIKRILRRFYYPQAGVEAGDPKPLTDKDRMKRKSRNKMVRKSRRRNRW